VAAIPTGHVIGEVELQSIMQKTAPLYVCAAIDDFIDTSDLTEGEIRLRTSAAKHSNRDNSDCHQLPLVTIQAFHSTPTFLPSYPGGVP
jgi:hypothetical protein